MRKVILTILGTLLVGVLVSAEAIPQEKPTSVASPSAGDLPPVSTVGSGRPDSAGLSDADVVRLRASARSTDIEEVQRIALLTAIDAYEEPDSLTDSSSPVSKVFPLLVPDMPMLVTNRLGGDDYYFLQLRRPSGVVAYIAILPVRAGRTWLYMIGPVESLQTDSYLASRTAADTLLASVRAALPSRQWNARPELVMAALDEDATASEFAPDWSLGEGIYLSGTTRQIVGTRSAERVVEDLKRKGIPAVVYSERRE